MAKPNNELISAIADFGRICRANGWTMQHPLFKCTGDLKYQTETIKIKLTRELGPNDKTDTTDD